MDLITNDCYAVFMVRTVLLIVFTLLALGGSAHAQVKTPQANQVIETG